jgi:hypothetical protein
MLRISALAAVLALVAPAAVAHSASRKLLVDGDSLAVGTKPYIPRDLPGWKVTQSASVSRHAYQGADVMRSYGKSLPRVIHVSLGTNDDPNDVDGFRAAVRDVMKVAGSRRCVVWTNIVRPKAAGATYAGYNHVLAREDARRRNLRVVNWVRMVRKHPEWLVGDGVHVNAIGYKARAKAVAGAVRRCR